MSSQKFTCWKLGQNVKDFWKNLFLSLSRISAEISLIKIPIRCILLSLPKLKKMKKMRFNEKIKNLLCKIYKICFLLLIHSLRVSENFFLQILQRKSIRKCTTEWYEASGEKNFRWCRRKRSRGIPAPPFHRKSGVSPDGGAGRAATGAKISRCAGETCRKGARYTPRNLLRYGILSKQKSLDFMGDVMDQLDLHNVSTVWLMISFGHRGDFFAPNFASVAKKIFLKIIRSIKSWKIFKKIRITKKWNI